MSVLDDLDPEDARLCLNAEILAHAALRLGEQSGANAIEMAMTLGFAATKLLFRVAENDAQAMQSIGTFCQGATQSMADMIAGEDAGNQVMQ